MDYRNKFVVEPGARVSLADFDADFKSGQDKTEASRELQAYHRQLEKLQYKLWAEHRHALLIVLQGPDTSGKDGVIRHVIIAMNPQGCRVTSFKEPTPQELDHDFLWRVHAHAPARGEVAVFNRSHYEDVLVARVHDLVPASVWSARYELINAFEEGLHVDNDTTILKFFLHISKEEQLTRLVRRLTDPMRQWKVSESDFREREHWDDYVAAYEDALGKTSTRHAPWFVIPANHKWFRNLAIATIVVETMRSLDIALPGPKVDVQRLRERFQRTLKELEGKREEED